ncbi:MAG: AAA family ATPase, partial [Tatlockia sp.]|nr:AAA family ATPase [Tatlockia sp.]
TPHFYEVALLFLLLSGVFLHRLPEIQTMGLENIDLKPFLPHFVASILALIIPVIIPIAAYVLMQLIYRLQNTKPRSFVELAYGYLPLVLGANLAHYLRLGLGEAGRIIPVTLATFGYSSSSMPVLVAHPAVTAFLQGVTLISSILLTILLTQKIARQPLRSLLPQHLATILLGSSLWVIIVGR